MAEKEKAGHLRKAAGHNLKQKRQTKKAAKAKKAVEG
jgi:hypothetical protein